MSRSRVLPAALLVLLVLPGSPALSQETATDRFRPVPVPGRGKPVLFVLKTETRLKIALPDGPEVEVPAHGGRVVTEISVEVLEGRSAADGGGCDAFVRFGLQTSESIAPGLPVTSLRSDHALPKDKFVRSRAGHAVALGGCGFPCRLDSRGGFGSIDFSRDPLPERAKTLGLAKDELEGYRARVGPVRILRFLDEAFLAAPLPAEGAAAGATWEDECLIDGVELPCSTILRRKMRVARLDDAAVEFEGTGTVELRASELLGRLEVDVGTTAVERSSLSIGARYKRADGLPISVRSEVSVSYRHKNRQSNVDPLSTWTRTSSLERVAKWPSGQVPALAPRAPTSTEPGGK